MKIHDLHPAEGSVTRRTRVGRGIAAGKGKTAGRGTKGQKSRAGASIPAWFEGGQTPLHIRIPKLRGFRNINDIEYEVVNVGAISAAVDSGRLQQEKGAPVTVNADTLKAAGLVRRDRLAAQDPRPRRGRREAVRAGGRLHEERPREDRGGRRHGPGHRDPELAARRPRCRAGGRRHRQRLGARVRGPAQRVPGAGPPAPDPVSSPGSCSSSGCWPTCRCRASTAPSSRTS